MTFAISNLTETSRRIAKIAAALAVSASISALAAAQAQDTITFDDVFSNPDDKQLNIDYARQEAAAGNLLASAATLERLLLTDPNWDEARLFYAAVLYRLADYSGAEREVRILEGRSLSPQLQEQLEDFKGRIDNKQRKTRLSGSIAVGFTYDDNVAVNNDDPSIDPNNAPTQSDEAFTFRARGKYEYEIGGEQDLKFVALFSTLSKRYDDFGRVDFNFIAARTGFEGANGPYDWRILADFKNLDIVGDQYLREGGASVRVRREMTAQTSLQLDADASYQEYDNITIGNTETLFEDQRAGLKYTVIGSVNHKFDSQTRGSVGIGYQKKEADFEAYEFDTAFFTTSLSRSFKNGSYAIGSYFYRDVEYAAPDTIVVPGATEPREEDRHYARVAVGVPVGAVFESENANLQETLDDLRVEFSVFYDDRQANFDVYDYDNTGAEVQLIWNFDR
ncbi:surface lipoprotein assembly modifier [Parvularcula sp. IMCC14364]|uniref:surface lipoprotein assembly modifier n=1 Tax=Parvularcula sp. IMCC14364 TaxID=3067902 RepID=UPI00274220D1|nr:hypothetical protein [Parvularcula sp. IMCC14364]